MTPINPEFQSLFNVHETAFLTYFDQLVQIPSVNGHATFEAPFGIGPKRALAYLLRLSAKLGFRTGSAGDCVGWAEAGPIDEPEFFGVLGHLDVVDVENDWHYPPFKLTRVDDMLYGRGTLDNKGPLLATLLALFLIKEQGAPLKHRVRILFGTDEESGSRDIPRYLAEQPAPATGITPDCKFPIVYGERGLIDLTLTTKITDGSLTQLKSLTGPFDRSYLPDQATVELADGTVTKFTGKKAPSNAPDLADNVLPQVVAQLSQLTGDTGKFFQWLADKIGQQVDGQRLGLDFEDVASGKLQLSFYQVSLEAGQLTASISMRYPISMTEPQLLTQLQSQLASGMTITINRRLPSKLSDPDQPFIHRFSKIYAADTGLDGTPVTTTGATYARAMPNIVAFGPSFPGQKGIAHKGDEWLKLSDWQLMMNIYYDCLLAELT